VTSSKARLALLALSLIPALAPATDLVYVPRNPAFGGNPLNGSILLQEAQVQNHYSTDPSQKPQTALDQFNSTLQSIILGRLASAIAGNVFDPTTGKLVPGTINTSQFTITITDLGGGKLNITTIDRTTGQQTTFEVSQ
jgi:curli production assembly/transport component CsgF